MLALAAQLQCLYRYKTNDQTKNFPLADAGRTLLELIDAGFSQVGGAL
jgi:hypothetical protein